MPIVRSNTSSAPVGVFLGGLGVYCHPAPIRHTGVRSHTKDILCGSWDGYHSFQAYTAK